MDALNALFAAGCNLTIKDADGETPLDVAGDGKISKAIKGMLAKK
jgi:hypothetical protein